MPDARSFIRSRPRTIAALAAAVPVLWLPLAVVHPFGIEDVTRHGQDGTWLGVHAAMLVLTPLLGLAVLTVLSRLTGTAATVGRLAVVAWVGFFAAFESIAGIGTGVLARLGEADAAEALFGHGVVGGDFSVLGFVAHPLWGVVAVATASALRANGAPVLAWSAMLVSAVFVIGHAGPLAVVAFTALAVALWLGITAPLRTEATTAEHHPAAGNAAVAARPST